MTYRQLVIEHGHYKYIILLMVRSKIGMHNKYDINRLKRGPHYLLSIVNVVISAETVFLIQKWRIFYALLRSFSYLMLPLPFLLPSILIFLPSNRHTTKTIKMLLNRYINCFKFTFNQTVCLSVRYKLQRSSVIRKVKLDHCMFEFNVFQQFFRPSEKVSLHLIWR